MKNAWHSLFHVARERRRDSFTNRVHTFLFAWVAWDLFWHVMENWSFFIFIFWQLQLFSRGFKAYRYFIYEKMAAFLYEILCFSGSQVLLKCKWQKKQ